MTRLEPVHPGEVLKHDFMAPFGLSAAALARAVGVTPARIALPGVRGDEKGAAGRRRHGILHKSQPAAGIMA